MPSRSKCRRMSQPGNHLMSDDIDDWHHPIYAVIWLNAALDGQSVADIAAQCVGGQPSAATIIESIHARLIACHTLH